MPFINKVVDTVQRQISPMVQTVLKTIETQQLQCIDKVIDVPVVSVAQAPQLLSDVQAPTMQVVEKTVEDPQLQIVVETAKTPETQMIQGTRTSESLGNAPVYQATQAGHVEEVEIGASIPSESASPVFVSTLVVGCKIRRRGDRHSGATGDDARSVGARCRSEEVGLSSSPAH